MSVTTIPTSKWKNSLSIGAVIFFFLALGLGIVALVTSFISTRNTVDTRDVATLLQGNDPLVATYYIALQGDLHRQEQLFAQRREFINKHSYKAELWSVEDSKVYDQLVLAYSAQAAVITDDCVRYREQYNKLLMTDRNLPFSCDRRD